MFGKQPLQMAGIDKMWLKVYKLSKDERICTFLLDVLYMKKKNSAQKAIRELYVRFFKTKKEIALKNKCAND